jgi:hypothetical protein
VITEFYHFGVRDPGEFEHVLMTAALPLEYERRSVVNHPQTLMEVLRAPDLLEPDEGR